MESIDMSRKPCASRSSALLDTAETLHNPPILYDRFAGHGSRLDFGPAFLSNGEAAGGTSMIRNSSGRGYETKQVRLKQNFCFACGPDNPEGMRLKFAYDEEGKCFVSHFRLPRRYTGPPGYAHGGIIATILDEVMGKVNRLRQIVAMTAEMTVQYRKPVPLGETLIAEGRELRVRGRVHVRVGEIRNGKGDVLARARGKFIAIDPQKVFAKHLRGGAAKGQL
jgi:uncharacterized protein (TIGR00369 family)